MATQPKQVVLREFNNAVTFDEAVGANRVVVYSGAGTVSLPTGADQLPAGVTERAYEAGEVGEVVTKKIMRCITQAAVTQNTMLSIGSTAGDVKTAGSAAPLVGRALTTQGSVGAYVEVELLIGNYNPA